MTLDESSMIDSVFKGLELHDVDEHRREKVRREAHRILRCQRDARRASGRTFFRILEPALVCGLALVILLWAFSRAAFILS